MDSVVVTGSSDHRRRRKGSSSGHVVAQLLESPLPTPRRSCCGRPAADTPAARRGIADASPQRGHVPFKWESSPGVPKSAAAAAGGNGKADREVPPLPKPPAGRCATCHARARAYHHGNATDLSSDDDTCSDALDRISSSDRLAALSARLSAIDGGGAVFGSSRRSPSFIMDRFLPAANAIATTTADLSRPRRPPRRSSIKSSKRDRENAEAEAAARARFVTHILRRRALAVEQPKRHPPHCQREEEQMTPRACGFMFFVPWSAKPVLLRLQRSPRARSSRTPPPRASSSPPRRSVTLCDVLEKERKLRRDGGRVSHWCDEKSGSDKDKEWAANPGWGMALLGTSKRYCADARKALSRLTRSGMDSGDGDSPRIGRQRSRSKHKQAASMLRSTAVEMPPLSPPSESWLSNARRSNAGVTKVDGAAC